MSTSAQPATTTTIGFDLRSQLQEILFACRALEIDGLPRCDASGYLHRIRDACRAVDGLVVRRQAEMLDEKAHSSRGRNGGEGDFGRAAKLAHPPKSSSERLKF